MDPNVKILSTIGYEDIVKTKIINSKTVRFTFRKPFAGWKTLFGQPLPAHALQGEDFNKVWLNDLNNPKTGKPISDGPFYLPSGGWQRGRQLTLQANPKYWGPKAKLARLVYRFLPDTNTTAEQIRGGEVDVIYPQPQLFLVPLRHQRGLRTQVGRGRASSTSTSRRASAARAIRCSATCGCGRRSATASTAVCSWTRFTRRRTSRRASRS
jgi:glutathione transport system substrate-binding protein